MLKLCKLTPDTKSYWETWDNGDGSHTIHWGSLGSRGESKVVKSTKRKPAEDQIQKEIDSVVADGFAVLGDDHLVVLIIEYPIDDMGTVDDVDKRHSLEGRLNETLGWTGLGHCDGGSIGSGSMEVFNFVVDFELAKQVVQKDLEGTKFADFSRIYGHHDG